MIIGLDVDSVVAELSPAWYGRYNKDYNDDLKPEKITDWNTHQFVKPECGTKIYEYLKDPTLYDDVKPISGALRVVNKLKKNPKIRIIYITTSPIESYGRKFTWLVEHGFLEPKELHNYFEVKDKNLIRADVLLDDNYDNANNFPGLGLLFDQPWNKKYKFDNRIYNWQGFYNFIRLMNF